MKIPQRNDAGGLGINMTPMIDVVFLLIIFFLVSSHLARRENEMQMALPKATSGEHREAATAHRLTLNVLASGQMFLAGTSISEDQLGGRLQSARKRSGENLELRIRADRSVDYQYVGRALAAAANAGIWNVAFAVIDAEGSP